MVQLTMAPKTDALLNTQRIVWGSLMFAPAIYLLVYFVQRSGGHLPTDPEPILLPALAVVAVGVLVASFVVPRMLLRNAFKRAAFEVEEVVDDEPQLFRRAPKTTRVFNDPGEVLRRATMMSMPSLILGSALGEAVILFGLVLGWLGLEPLNMAPFFVLGWVAIAVHFPSKARVAQALEKITGARLTPAKGSAS